MALKSERHETVVNPDEGIYVEMEQIMEVHFEFKNELVKFMFIVDCPSILQWTSL